MDSDYKIFWTGEAVDNLASILGYLEERWTQKEVGQFKHKLTKQLDLIVQNPEIFPISQTNPRLRKAVLSIHTTIFYELSGKIIYLVYLFSNYQNPDRIK